MKKVLRLGTRKSLLAVAQSSWVAREIERVNPEISVELVGIETRGDRILDVPLTNVQGKEFFVAELDEALIQGSIDFTVHSMKDLSLDRPSSLSCAAIPLRKNPRDVILFGPHTLQHIEQGRTLKIGTSSPRRIENIPQFLSRALPRLSPKDSGWPDSEFIEIRGNVNTRLSRVQEDPASPRYLDGVVLAFAGMIRLWEDEEGQAELQRLLRGVRWMILPLKECPTAPAQGALALECRSADQETRAALGKIHHLDTATKVARERKLLSDWGGGCHQRFGATAIRVSSLGEIFYIRGVKPDGSSVDDLQWDAPAPTFQSEIIKAWNGTEWRGEGFSSLKCEHLSDLSGKAVFIAHPRAISAVEAEIFRSAQGARVWVSGTSSWKKLAEQGIWVEGCAEGLGFEELFHSHLSEAVLTLPVQKEWTILTHAQATAAWEAKGMQAFGTYEVKSNYGNEAKTALLQASHIFWSSGSQFDELKEWVSKQSHHACGSGKTAGHLQMAGVNPEIFPSAEEWKKWLKKSQV